MTSSLFARLRLLTRAVPFSPVAQNHDRKGVDTRKPMHWLLLALATLPAFGQDRVDPAITVTDINGRVVRPFQTLGKTAFVIFFVTNDCPISNIYAREIHRICDA